MTPVGARSQKKFLYSPMAPILTLGFFRVYVFSFNMIITSGFVMFNGLDCFRLSDYFELFFQGPVKNSLQSFPCGIKQNNKQNNFKDYFETKYKNYPRQEVIMNDPRVDTTFNILTSCKHTTSELLWRNF